MNQRKILNLLLIITSLLGYLEWSGDNHAFLFQVEGEILSKLFTDPISVLHPLTILPLTWQVVLLVTLFQKIPGKTLTYLGIGGLGILFALLLVIGVMINDGKVKDGKFPFLQAMVTGKYLESPSRLAAIPMGLQNVLINILGPMARLFGYRALYKKYTGIEK